MKLNLRLFIVSLVFLIVFSHCQNLNKSSQSALSVLPEVSSSPLASRSISSLPSCSLNHKGAVIVMYHRFDGKHSSTSVTESLLREHIHYFLSNGFRIISLEQVVRALQTGQALPDKALAITIDDAYRSAYDIAHPLFVKHKIPYTLFVNTEAIDRSLKDYMTWNQIRSLKSSGLVALEAHSHTHAYMIREMSATQRERDVKTSVMRIYKETGQLPRYFAYPYGETHNLFVRELKNYRWNIGGKIFRFQAAFTTQSGPAGCSSSLFALPRFALNMNYGKMNQLFKHKMNSGHFSVRNFSPDDFALCSKHNHKRFSLAVDSGLSLERLNCFASNGGLNLKLKSNYQAEIILNNPMNQGLRQRINCTLPRKSGGFFWLGREFTILKCP